MKNIEKYKKLIQSVKNTDQFSQDEIDIETKIIVLRQFTAMCIDDKFEILQDIVRAETSRRKDDKCIVKSYPSESVEDFNKKELIKLKMFFLRFLTLTLLFIVGSFFLIYILLGSEVVHSSNALIDEAIVIFQQLFQ
jgi:hypothetical protein